MGERFEPCTSLCKNKDFTNWSRGNPSPRTMAKLESPKKVVTIYIGKTRTSSEGSDFLDWLEVLGAFGSNLVKVECRYLSLILAVLLFKLIRLMSLLIAVINKILQR